WVTNAQGLVLMLYMARVEGERELYDRYALILSRHDIWPADISRKKWIKMHIADHDKKINFAREEKQKYKCAFIGQEVLSFMYFFEMQFIFEKPNIFLRGLKSKVQRILFDSQKMLIEALKE